MQTGSDWRWADNTKQEAEIMDDHGRHQGVSWGAVLGVAVLLLLFFAVGALEAM
jgi:hypothetical protein